MMSMKTALRFKPSQSGWLYSDKFIDVCFASSESTILSLFATEINKATGSGYPWCSKFPSFFPVAGFSPLTNGDLLLNIFHPFVDQPRRKVLFMIRIISHPFIEIRTFAGNDVRITTITGSLPILSTPTIFRLLEINDKPGSTIINLRAAEY